MKKPNLTQRLKAKNRSQAMIVALTWYTPETWAEMKAAALDPECFEDSFAKWEVAAKAARSNFVRSGVRAVEVQIVPAEFEAWCAESQQQNNSAGRSEFVSEVLSAAFAARG